jgi:hypothetical protein
MGNRPAYSAGVGTAAPLSSPCGVPMPTMPSRRSRPSAGGAWWDTSPDLRARDEFGRMTMRLAMASSHASIWNACLGIVALFRGSPATDTGRAISGRYRPAGSGPEWSAAAVHAVSGGMTPIRDPSSAAAWSSISRRKGLQPVNRVIGNQSARWVSRERRLGRDATRGDRPQRPWCVTDVWGLRSDLVRCRG